MDKLINITNTNEADRIDRVRQDPDGFTGIYQEYVRRIFRYLYSRVGNLQEAEDLTAQVFLSALESMHHFHAGGNIAAWLFGIARNKTVDHYRKREKVEPLDEVERSSGENDPLSRVIKTERAKALAGLIQALPEGERELLRLRYLGELSFDEMAKALKKNPDAVKKTLYRLLQRLQRQLENYND